MIKKDEEMIKKCEIYRFSEWKPFIAHSVDRFSSNKVHCFLGIHLFDISSSKSTGKGKDRQWNTQKCLWDYQIRLFQAIPDGISSKTASHRFLDLKHSYLPFYFIQKGSETIGISVQACETSKYGYFSHFWMESDKINVAIEFPDLNNLGLPLYFSQKDSETTQICCFDRNYCIRHAINAINGLWHMQFLLKWYTCLCIPAQICLFHNARLFVVWKKFSPSQLGRQRPQKRKDSGLVCIWTTFIHATGVTNLGTL